MIKRVKKNFILICNTDSVYAKTHAYKLEETFTGIRKFA